MFFTDSITRCYVAMSLLSKFGISVISALYVTFLMEHGLDLFQASMVNFVFYVTQLVFRIPSGGVADLWGRRRSAVTACVLMGVGLCVYAQVGTFMGFIAAEALIAIGATLFNGAFLAWLHDRLDLAGRVHEERKIIASTEMLEQVTMMMAALLGAVTAASAMTLPFFIGGGAMFACAVVAMVAMKDGAYRTRSFWRLCITLRLGIRYTWRHGAIRALFLLGLLQTAALQAPNMQWQPFFSGHLPNEAWLGGVKVVIALSLMLGAWLAGKLAQQHSERGIIVAQIVIAAGVGLSGMLPFELAVVAFMVHEVARGFFNPIKRSFLNSCINSKRKRATIISCCNLGNDLGGVIGLPASGAIALRAGIELTWVIAGTLLYLGVLIVRRRLVC